VSRVTGGWPDAFLFAGIVDGALSGRFPELFATVNWFLDLLLDGDGQFRVPFTTVDQCMLGQSLLRLNEQNGSPRLECAIQQIADFLTVRHVRSHGGSLPYRQERPRIVLVDTVGMICPFLAAYGRAFGSSEALGLAVRQMDEFIEKAIEPRSGLPFHGFDTVTQQPLGPVGWARGTGWLVTGIACSLQPLRNHDQQAYSRLRLFLDGIIARLHNLQAKNGCFTWLLNFDSASPDASGTAMIGYAALVAAAGGAVSSEVALPVAEAALKGLITFTRKDGYVEQGQGECIDVGLYPDVFGPTPWTQGAAAQLAVRMIAETVR